MTLYIIISALCIMLASLAGGIFTSQRLGTFLHKNLPYLITFSIGVFITITWGLFSEAFEHNGFWLSTLTAMLGALFIKLAAHLIPNAHHHHDTPDDHTHSKIDARHILLGDAIHNLGDGLLLVPAFLVSTSVGIATALSIFIHEFVQEVSEFFILKQAGYTTKQALVRNFIVSTTLLIGVGLSLAISHVEVLEAPLLSFAGGGFLYIVFRDLLPNTHEAIQKRGGSMKHLYALIFGFIIMFGVGILVPHTHEEHEEDAHTEALSETL